MGLIRTEALVLKTLDYAETTQIARFFSPSQGKFSAMARGVKRTKSRLGPLLDIFAQVEVSVYLREGRSMGTVSAIEPGRAWPALRTDLERNALASLMMETIDRGMEEHKASERVYALALRFLEQMQSATDPEALTARALLRLICLLGFAPDLRPPKSASRSDFAPAPPVFFLFSEGRLSHSPSAEGGGPSRRMEPVPLAFLRQAMTMPVEEFADAPSDPRPVRASMEFVIWLTQQCLEAELKSGRFLRKMIWV